MFRHRVILGLPLTALFVGLITIDWFAAGGWPLADWSTPPGLLVACVCVIAIPLALWEMRNLLARQNVNISLRITIAAALLCMIWPWLGQFDDSIQERLSWPATVAGVAPPGSPERLVRLEASPWYDVAKWSHSVKPHYLIPTVLAAAFLAALIKHSRDRRVEGAMASAGGTLLAIVYLGVLPGFFLPICMTHSAWMMFAIVAVVKCADVGAFATGKLIGKHKLIAWLSPGKTVEGFIGGLTLAGIVGAVIAGLMKNSPPVNPVDAERWARISLTMAIVGGGLSGILLGAVGQVGDLLESLLKRDAGVKDSGAVPGFGGVLDILDSPLLAAPVAYWLLKLVLR
jgi:CDP-diglyceride synthetase